MIRDIIAITVSFALGLAAATAYFYHVHPEHHFMDDLPLMRRDYDKAVQTGEDAARRLQKPEQPPAATNEPASGAGKPNQ